jgi:aspartate/methionine/tyrosine aminotransferase
MKIHPFELERYFAHHEFSAKYLLSSSDCESLSLLELLEMAPQEHIELWIDLKLGYTESEGHPKLRQAIAETYEDISPDETLGVVPEEGIFLLMHALLEPGDHVICTYPGYQSLYEIARSIGCHVSYWEPIEDEGWHFDVEHLQKMIRSNTRLVVVNFPHNPTGFVPTADDFARIIGLLSARGIHLLSDEMYRYLEVEAGSTLPAGCEQYERAISLSGLSKSYGLPGLRVGWVSAHDKELLARMMALKDYTTICASAPSEILAVFALANKEPIVARHLDRIRRNLQLLDGFFDEYADCFQWNRPLGGSIGFARLVLEIGATDFCNKLVADTGIMLAPSSVFQYGERHVRIGYGRENLPEVIGLFRSYLDAQFR